MHEFTQALRGKKLLLVGFTLFSMFFGAGNLIFPPFLGAQAGTALGLAFAGFAVSAIGLPIAGVAAVARAGGLPALAGRVHPRFAQVFAVLVYLSIGPCLAIPRTASTSFEMLTPLVGRSTPGQFIYSLVFFAAAYIVALKPEKLTQPYVTAAQMKDSGLRVVLDLTREWNKVCDTQLITGVTVVRTEYAKQNPDVIAAFLTDYQKSVKAANEDIDGTAALCEEVGVVAKAAIAKKALPKCNIVYRNGQEMKKDISAYLQVLYDASPAAVGGKLPDDNFYYTEPSVLRKVMAAIRNSAK